MCTSVFVCLCVCLFVYLFRLFICLLNFLFVSLFVACVCVLQHAKMYLSKYQHLKELLEDIE